MGGTFYYSSLFILIGMLTQKSTTQNTSYFLGLHLFIAPFIIEICKFDFFWFYATWDLFAIALCLYIEALWRKLLLILVFSASFQLHSFNAILWDTPNLFIYTYYQQIDMALLECVVAILASTLNGKLRRMSAFGGMALVFFIFRMHP